MEYNKFMGFGLNNLVIIFLLIFNILLFIFYLNSLLRLRAASKTVIDTTLSNLVFQDNVNLNNKDDQDIHQENFIKFLSDSRDWAFDYIDKSQKQIKEFIEIADKEFAFFDSYGILSQEYPNYNAMKTISEEYKKLKSLLPEETDDRR